MKNACVGSLHMEKHTQNIVSNSTYGSSKARVSSHRLSQMHLSSSFSPYHTEWTAFVVCLWATLLLAFCNGCSCAAHYDPPYTVVASSALAHMAMPSSGHDAAIAAVGNGKGSDTALRRVTRISTSDLQSRQALERSIQMAAFKQFDSHKTAKLYNVSVPTIPSGTFQAIRLRSGSLRRYGVTINEFTIPRGCEVKPAVPERVLLVYTQLANRSLFQSLPGGFVLASPVLSVLVYDATNLNSTQPPSQLSISTIANLISIRFTQKIDVQCAYFYENSTDVNYTNLDQGVCQVDHLGTFALVSNAPAPTPSSAPFPTSSPVSQKRHSNTWKIVVGSVVGGLALLLLVSLLAIGIGNHRKNAKLARMEYQADQGVTLQTATIRNSRAPTAGETRTQPTLEKDYAV